MNDQFKRFTVYLDEEKTRYLKSHLMMQKTNFSVWMRDIIDQALKAYKEQGAAMDRFLEYPEKTE